MQKNINTSFILKQTKPQTLASSDLQDLDQEFTDLFRFHYSLLVFSLEFPNQGQPPIFIN